MKIAKFSSLTAAAILSLSGAVFADVYKIDSEGAHASINFKTGHLGYSMLTGRFDKFEGTFDFNEANPAGSSVQVTIDTASLNSNHAARDKHLRSADFLDVATYPEATFASTRITVNDDKSATIHGNLTLHGVTKEIAIEANHIGGGKDPWGGFRQGFEGTTTIAMEDFGIKNILGPASANIELELHVEGIKQ